MTNPNQNRLRPKKILNMKRQSTNTQKLFQKSSSFTLSHSYYHLCYYPIGYSVASCYELVQVWTVFFLIVFFFWFFCFFFFGFFLFCFFVLFFVLFCFCFFVFFCFFFVFCFFVFCLRIEFHVVVFLGEEVIEKRKEKNVKDEKE